MHLAQHPSTRHSHSGPARNPRRSWPAPFQRIYFFLTGPLPILIYLVSIGLAYVVIKLVTVGLWELEFNVKTGIKVIWKGLKGLEGGARAWGESLFSFSLIYLLVRFMLFVC
jgi:heme O synthase-like polyprenyltransferase